MPKTRVEGGSPYLDEVDCSYQPLDFCFHPTRHTWLAAALVDGSVELHDFLAPEPGKNIIRGPGKWSDAEDEHDTLVNSLYLHRQYIPKALPLHKGESPTVHASCKTVQFSVDGVRLFSGGSAGDFVGVDADRAIQFDREAGCERNMLWRVPGATAGVNHPITVIQPFENNHSLLATGDDNGGIRIWDQRIIKPWVPSDTFDTSISTSNPTETTRNEKKSEKKKKKKNKKNKQHESKPPRPPGCVRSWDEHEDYISAIQISEDGNTLLSTSADCRLGVYDLRMPGQVTAKKDPNQLPDGFRLSDDQEDELLSLQIMKHGKKAVCGTQNGVLSIFSWGTWGDCSDRFPGHPQSIDTLLKVDEDTLLTGSSDGRIRVVQIQPDKLLGVIGHDHHGYPIEKLGFNSNRHIVGSLTHSNYIRLNDAKILLDEADSDDDDDEKDRDTNTESVDERKMSAKTKAAAATTNGSDDEWDDMDDKNDDDDDDEVQTIGDSSSEEDSDEDDDSDGEPETVNDRRKKRFKTANEQFFADL